MTEESVSDRTVAVFIIILAVVSTILVAYRVHTGQINLSDTSERYLGEVVRVEIGKGNYDGSHNYLYTVDLDSGGSVQYLDEFADFQRFHVGDIVQVWGKGSKYYLHASLVSSRE